MKRSVITFILCLAFAHSGLAQIDFGPRFSLLASNITLQNGRPWFNSDFEVGYQIGVYARIEVPGTQWYVQPEALFSVSGGFINVPSGRNDYDLQRLDFPVLAGRKLGPVRVNAGPVIRWNLPNKSRVTWPDGAISYIGSAYKDVSLGYQAGVGMDVMKLLLDLKYEGSISDVRGDLGPVLFGSTTRINQFILAVGYKLF